jgi:hypothetical protein
VHSTFYDLADLAGGLRDIGGALAGQWERVGALFAEWAGQPGLVTSLQQALRAMPAEAAAAVAARSRETTTHFAWRLVDSPNGEFSFWLNEYKPQRDWRPGYADSVHNHRYHFCTTILRGSYVQEHFRVELAAAGAEVTDAVCVRRSLLSAGAVWSMRAEEFHRIPEAADGTVTFLVKSRPVQRWSLSYDPDRRASHRHVPVESRFHDLADRLRAG